MRWQQLVRLALGLFVLIFGAVVLRGIRARETPEAPVASRRADPEALVESTGAIVTQAKGARRDFRVEAARQLTFASGATRLESVKVTVLERAGRNFEVTGHEAEIGQDRSRIAMSGDVVMEASDGLTARTEHAVYHDQEGLLKAPGQVEFERDRLSGSGVGATYNQKRDVLWLLDQAHVLLTADPGTSGGTEITAGAAGLARRDRYIRFERDVWIVRPDRILSADTVMAFLAPAEDRIDRLELRGHSRIVGRDQGAGALETMEADDMNLEYDESGSVLRRAVLAGNASVQTTDANGQPGQTIHAAWIDTALAPDGSTITSLEGRDRVRLDIPSRAATPARQITAETLDGRGEPGRGLTSATFTGDVVFRERVAATEGTPAADRLARSSTLEVSFGQTAGTVEQVHFPTSMVFEDGRVTASALEATYKMTDDVIDLGGTPPATTRPIVREDGLIVEADTIALTVSGQRLVAAGDVRSTAPPAEGTGDSGRDVDATRRRPGLLGAEETMYVTGAALDYDGEAGRAVYSGDARLWQADTAVHGDTIVLDEKTGDMTATGSVRASMLLEQTEESTSEIESVASIASASAMTYDNAGRVITYTTQAHVTGPQGDLTAEKIEMFLGGEADTLDRVEAYETVTLLSPARTATGDRLTFFSADERYLMLGTPVTIEEACRVTNGKTLTFFKSTDTITVDGDEQIRTESTTGKECPEPPVE